MLNDWVAYEAEQKGIEEGRAEGRAEGIRILVEACRELGIPDSVTLEKIVEKFKIPYGKATEYLI